MTKAIAFDMGGVLLGLDIEAAIRAFRERLGFETIDEYLDLYFQRGFLKGLEDGSIDEEQGYEEIFKRCRPGITREDIQDCYREFVLPMEPRRAEILKELHGRFDLYLLSNNNPIAFNHVCRQYFEQQGVPVEVIFRKMFNSFEMKIMKPAPEMFRRVIESIGAKPEEILFIDDSRKNVDGALASGIDARLYTGIEDLEKLLEL